MQDGGALSKRRPRMCRVLRRAALLTVSFATLIAAPALAQERAGEQKGAAAGNFDFYVLALSWSPGFCALDGDEKGREQCATGKGLGFVVHGLWPQYDRGFPTECAPAGRTPSRLALDEVKDVYPDEGLARFEWRRHGTCSGKSPTDYFADVKKAREKIVIPQAFAKPTEDQRWTPVDLERAFVAANTGLRTDMLAIVCRKGLLQEVRVCFSRDLRQFQTCPDVDRRGCRGGPTTVKAAR
jgi:ribonuclease T2